MKTYQQQRPYLGNVAQLFAVTEYRMTGGEADGMRAVDVDNGGGLRFTVLPDRCMDIGRVSFRGNNMAFLTPSAYVNSVRADAHGVGWLHTFDGGLLTTCGFENIGVGGNDNGQELPLHGSLSCTPAEHFGVQVDETGEVPEVVMTGTMRCATVFGTRILLKRTIRCAYRDNRIRMADTIVNIGFSRAPLMRLYHMNIGYPLLDENAEILIPSREVKPRNAHAAEGLARWDRAEPPTAGYEEQCFYHTPKTDAAGNALVGVVQPALETGLFIGFETASLDRLVEWKMMGQGDYVLGLEPGNATLDGRRDAAENGSLKWLEAGQTVCSAFTWTFVHGEKEIAEMKEKQKQYQ